MFSLTVRDHVLIAHSLKGDAFGPAQRLHGATFVVEAEFGRPELDANNMVIDIGRALEIVRAAGSRINYRNLDELEEMRGAATTAEFVARYLHGEIARLAKPSFSGRLKVTLRESPSAWASYEADV